MNIEIIISIAGVAFLVVVVLLCLFTSKNKERSKYYTRKELYELLTKGPVIIVGFTKEKKSIAQFVYYFQDEIDKPIFILNGVTQNVVVKGKTYHVQNSEDSTLILEQCPMFITFDSILE